MGILTFLETQRDIFEKNCKALNATVDIGALHRRNLEPEHREPGTCQWIFELDDFKKWMSAGNNEILFVSGEAGKDLSITLRLSQPLTLIFRIWKIRFALYCH
jgi:hypothetical protein